MSIETLTTDEFMDLTLADHEAAIALYESETTRLNAQAKELQESKTSPGSLLGVVFDKMCSYLCLRKVHVGRLEEMREEAREMNRPTVATAA